MIFQKSNKTAFETIRSVEFQENTELNLWDMRLIYHVDTDKDSENKLFEIYDELSTLNNIHHPLNLLFDDVDWKFKVIFSCSKISDQEKPYEYKFEDLLFNYNDFRAFRENSRPIKVRVSLKKMGSEITFKGGHNPNSELIISYTQLH